MGFLDWILGRGVHPSEVGRTPTKLAVRTPSPEKAMVDIGSDHPLVYWVAPDVVVGDIVMAPLRGSSVHGRIVELGNHGYVDGRGIRHAAYQGPCKMAHKA